MLSSRKICFISLFLILFCTSSCFLDYFNTNDLMAVAQEIQDQKFVFPNLPSSIDLGEKIDIEIKSIDNQDSQYEYRLLYKYKDQDWNWNEPWQKSNKFIWRFDTLSTYHFHIEIREIGKTTTLVSKYIGSISVIINSFLVSLLFSIVITIIFKTFLSLYIEIRKDNQYQFIEKTNLIIFWIITGFILFSIIINVSIFSKINAQDKNHKIKLNNSQKSIKKTMLNYPQWDVSLAIYEDIRPFLQEKSIIIDRVDKANLNKFGISIDRLMYISGVNLIEEEKMMFNNEQKYQEIKKCLNKEKEKNLLNNRKPIITVTKTPIFILSCSDNQKNLYKIYFDTNKILIYPFIE